MSKRNSPFRPSGRSTGRSVRFTAVLRSVTTTPSAAEIGVGDAPAAPATSTLPLIDPVDGLRTAFTPVRSAPAPGVRLTETACESAPGASKTTV